ncbi:MAG: hypothetical protein P0Y49_12870 [Candidatus Pedobacter colombiensis]|uniref:S9 family peptidase n=1 Tax=Candidatus Pedobacter colombiensis TaxID=3121371 RepID=A0AAJ6B5E1_9SPHI|nr:hypothetical protein [Pedobacter sp.]WEK17689.1 MAG: hypothetical protein P0Y49_12870 [Pedobacter sp.]
MTTRIAFLLIAFFACNTTFGQSQIGIIKDPQWNLVAAYDSKFKNTINLSDNSLAMVVGVPKVDFAVVNIDCKLAQKWLTPLSGYPLTIGKFKNNILVVAASDKNFIKNFGGAYKAYLLEEKTGRVLSEKIIYEGNKDFIEEPDFFFATDGSYFRMSVRLTLMKRKTGILALYQSDKSYPQTQDFSIINYDGDLNQREIIHPRMPEGEQWTTSNGADGSLFIATVDNKGGKISAATYIANSADPLKIVTIPMDIRKGRVISSILSTASAKPFINYLAIVYENMDKETTLITAKIDFKDGTSKVTKDVFDSKRVKELRKTFVPVNKTFDDLKFAKIEFLGVKHITEYGDKLLVSVAPSFFQASNNVAVTFDGSLLMKIYDQEVKELYHQFIPRTYMSLDGEGSKIAYSLKGNVLRMVANMRTGSLSTTSSLFAEMDFTTGKMLSTSKIYNRDIKRGFYVNTESVTWLNESFILPYYDKQRVFRTTIDAQMQLLSY